MSDTSLLALLRKRFDANTTRHPEITWAEVEQRLAAAGDKLHALNRMEDTGGEPDVVGSDPATGAMIFCDCSPESPAGRRSLCFDEAALNARKANKPVGSAMAMAEAMGITLLSEDQYRYLQTLGEFDRKTSSWIQTPDAIRQRGGALFCDRRYDTVFVYHNGADSYYAVRGFRGTVTI